MHQRDAAVSGHLTDRGEGSSGDAVRVRATAAQIVNHFCEEVIDSFAAVAAEEALHIQPCVRAQAWSETVRLPRPGRKRGGAADTVGGVAAALLLHHLVLWRKKGIRV